MHHRQLGAHGNHLAPGVSGHYGSGNRMVPGSVGSSGRLSSDPESFTQDESDTGFAGQRSGVKGHGFISGYNHGHGYSHYHNNQPRSRVPLSPKVTVQKGQSSIGASAQRTSQPHGQGQSGHIGQSVQKGQSVHPQNTQKHLQQHPPVHAYHISQESHNTQQQTLQQQQQPVSSNNGRLKQQRTRSQTPNEFLHNNRNSGYVNVHLNGYHSDAPHGFSQHHQQQGFPGGFPHQNGYIQGQGQLQGQCDEGYPAYPYKGYTLEETERLIQAAKKKNKISYFDLLPDDVMVRILGHLPSMHLCRCARVSRRFYSLVWDPALWINIPLNDPGLDVDRALKQLTKRLSYDTPSACVMVERINLNG